MSHARVTVTKNEFAESRKLIIYTVDVRQQVVLLLPVYVIEQLNAINGFRHITFEGNEIINTKNNSNRVCDSAGGGTVVTYRW